MTEKQRKKKWLHQKLGIRVIDSHAHYLSYAVIKGWAVKEDRMERRIQTRTDITTVDLPKPDEDLAKRWVTELDKYGIERIGMMVGSEAWEEFSEAMKRFPNRFYGYANINPNEPDAEEQARYAIQDLGFHGFKLYPVANQFHAYDKAAYKIYNVADEQDVPVLSHFGISIGPGVDLRFGNPLDLQPAARDFPDVKFGIAHMGAGMFRETLLLFYQTENCYMDTSGSNIWMRYIPYPTTLEGVLKRALEAAGPERIIFGTDSSMFPRGFRMNILDSQLQILKRLKVTQEGLERIFGGNARQLLDRT